MGSLLRGPQGCSSPFCYSGITGADTAEGDGTRPPPGLLLAQRLGGWAREMRELCRARVPQGSCQGQVCSVWSECPLQLAGAQDEAWSLPWWVRLPRGTSLSGSKRTTCLAAGPGSRAEQTPLHPQFIPRPRCEPWTLKHCGKASGRGLGPSARAASRPTPRGGLPPHQGAPKASGRRQGGLLGGLSRRQAAGGSLELPGGAPCSGPLGAVGRLGEATWLRAACPAGLCCGEGGLGGRALQGVWLALRQPGPGLGLQGVAGMGESQPR